MTSAKSLKRRAHNDQWWAEHPERTRCTAHYKSTGERCRVDITGTGATVCNKHGALAPHVLAAAANRIQSNVDVAATRLIEWLNDPSVDMRERVKIAHDLLDRGGLSPTSKHLVGLVGGGQGDTIETLFLGILGDPKALVDPAAAQAEQLEAVAARVPVEDDDDDLPARRGEDVVDAELVEEPFSLPSSASDAHAPAPSRTPKHIREGLARTETLRRAGLW